MSSNSTKQQQQEQARQQQEEQLRVQILQQQQRQQLQLHQQQQYQQQQQPKRSSPSFNQHLALTQQAQQRHAQQQVRRAQQHAQQLARQQQAQAQQQLVARLQRGLVAAATIATLQDALSYPEQPPQLAPLPPKSATWTSSSSPNSSATKSKSAAKRGKKKSVVAYADRKKFPRGLSRFRDRLQHLEERLTLDVNALKQEIRDLTLRRGLMETRTLTTRFCATGSAAKLIREYFATFHQGFQSVPARGDLGVTRGVHECSSSSSPGSSSPLLLLPQGQQLEATHRQSGFFSALVDPRMEFRKYVGRDVLMEQWLRYSQCHAGLRMQLFSIDTMATDDDDGDIDMDGLGSGNSTIVRARGKLTAYVTMQTLEQIFPSVLQYPALTQKLLGSYIEYALHIEFHVNSEGKITKYDPDVDFVGGLSKVLGNFEEVALAMRDALISHFSMIGRLEGLQEAQAASDSGAMQVPKVTLLEAEPESADSLESRTRKRRSSIKSSGADKAGKQESRGGTQRGREVGDAGGLRPSRRQHHHTESKSEESPRSGTKSAIDYILT